MAIRNFVACLPAGVCALSMGVALGRQPASSISGCPSRSLSSVISGPIGDLTGDAIDEVGVVEWHVLPAVNIVRVLDGASGAIRYEWIAPQGDFGFGVGVLAVGDFDGDSASDVAIASIVSDGVGIIRVFSSSSGKQIALLKEVPGGVPSVDDVKQMGDLDGSGVVGIGDLAEAIDLFCGDSPSPLSALCDWDGDGQVSLDEVLEVAALSGTFLSVVAKADLIAQVGALPQFDGQSSVGDSGGTVVAGRSIGRWIKCLVCAIKCGAALKHASDCIGVRDQIWAQCEALYPNTCSLECTECLESKERTALADCIQRVADAAGDCGECVYKCGPRPTL